MVDIKGQNRSLLDLRTAGFDDLDIPWQSGLSQTSGMRNKYGSLSNKYSREVHEIVYICGLETVLMD